MANKKFFVANQPLRKENFKEEADRYVLFMDIMGFKDRVFRKGHKEILSELTELQECLSKCMPEDNSIVFTMFSDSIVVLTNNDSEEAFLRLSRLGQYVLSKCMNELEMPIKGAIAYGKLTVNRSKQLYFGQPLIDAYLLEEEVKCYAVVLHHTVEAKLPINVINLYREGVIRMERVSCRHRYLALKDITMETLEKLSRQVSGSPRSYIDNTLTLLEDI